MSSDGYNLGNAYGRIVITDNIDEAVNQAQRSFDRGLSGMGQSMQRFGDQLTGVGARITALTAPLTVFGATGIRAAMDFDDAMAEISARTGLVGEDLDQISDAAKQMGAETVFSSQQAAQAFLELLSSGQTAEEALSTLPHVLTAAAAGGIDLGTAADTVTDILASFQLEVGDAEMVVNALARASASSSADISSLQQGFSNVGPVANQFGLDVEDVAATLAIFSENGIKGAEAGTQLRSMLMNMTRQTDTVTGAWDTLGISVYDADGNMRDLNDIMVDLNGVMESGTFTQQEMNKLLTDIGGSYGIMGLSALSAGMSIEEMQEMMAGQADATEVADARMNTFSGSVNSLMGSFETLQITVLTPFMNDVLKPMVQQLTQVINRITAWAAENPDLTKTIATIATALIALGPVLVGVGIAISTVGSAVSGLGAAFKLLALGPVGLLIGAVGALGYAFVNDLGGVRTFVTEAVEDIIDRLGGMDEIIATITRTAKDMLKQAKRFGQGMIVTLGPVIEQVGRFIENTFQQMAGYLVTVVIPAVQNIVDWFINRGLPLVVDFIQTVVVPNLQRFFDFLAGMWEVVGPGLGRFGDWFLNDVMPQVLDIVENQLYPLVKDVFTFLGEVWDIVGPALIQLADWFMNTALPVIMEFISGTVIPGISRFIGVIRDIWNEVSPWLLKFLDWFINTGMPQVITFIEDTLAPAVTNLIDKLKDIWQDVQPIIQKLIDWFQTTGWPLIQAVITETIIPAVEDVIGTLKDIWEAVSPVIQKLIDWFQTTGWPLIQAVIDEVIIPAVESVVSALTTIWENVEGPLNTMKDGLSTIFNFIKDNIIQPVIDIINKIPEAIQGALDTVTGAVEDIKSAVDSVTDLDRSGEGHGGMFGTGLGPDFDPLGGIRRDRGGPGMAGGLYHVGRSQIGHEAFIAGDNGQFYPDFARNLAQIANNVIAGQQMGVPGGSVTQSGLSQPSERRTVLEIGQISVNANDEAGGRRAADAFVDRLNERMLLGGN